MIYDNRHKKIKDDTTYITITHLGCRIYQITQGQCPYDTRFPKTKPECERVVIHGIHDIHITSLSIIPVKKQSIIRVHHYILIVTILDDE